jgi:glycerol-3-phosphate dehydrogenase
MGARALNYVEAVELLKSRQGVTGVTAFDRESRESHEYRANVVVNAAGPWCRELATRFDRDEPSLFRSSLAWNILLDREAVSDHAVAVTPKKPGARTYFIVPWKGLVLVGTGHAPWRSSSEKPMPSCQQIQEFLDDLNLSVPGLKVDQNDILHLFAGLLPVKRDGSVDLVCREVILDHANKGGPKGLFSVSGVKFTTARLVAEKTLRRTFPETKFSRQFTHRPGLRQSAYALDSYNTPNLVGLLDTRIGSIKDSYRHLVEEESVQHLDDLIFRRTTLWENPRDAISVAPLLCDLFPWNDFRCREEIERLASKLSNGHSQQDSG